MPLTRIQQTLWEKARAKGAGEQAVGLSDRACAYLIIRIAHDLGVEMDIPGSPRVAPDFFDTIDLTTLIEENVNARELFERLVERCPDADTYFSCLASLYKARLKYEAILESQPMPTLEQVGPRGLLQFGKLSPGAVAGLLFWRKWFFDIDNRAGQETGYLFEPVIAFAVGGIPKPAKKSPVKRHNDKGKGRQVDCLLGEKAYELKIRVTIAASGQGRWREELDFPTDCRMSGYKPVLVVLDGTPNAKLSELEKAFRDAGGEAYVGAAAWQHLEGLAGPTMSLFLESYIRGPIESLIRDAPQKPPEFSARMSNGGIEITVGGETLQIARREAEADTDGGDELPDDVGDDIPA